MALLSPAPLESAWQSVLACAVGRPVDPRALGIMVERLSRRDDGDDEATLAPADALAARALFWFSRDVRTVALAVAELVAAGALPGRPLRVLDLGAELGAASLGVVRASARHRFELARIEAVDRDAQALALLQTIAREASRVGLLPGLPEVVTRVGDPCDAVALAAIIEPGVDLLLVASTIVETDGDEVAHGLALAHAVASSVEAARLSDDGAVIVMAPATRAETRALHHARADLIAKGFGIFAPCTHQGPCPMLADDSDWCHEDLAAEFPPWLVPIARAAAMPREGLTFSYLVVRRDATRSVGDLAVREGFVPARLISRPRGTKGKTEAIACAGRGAEGREVYLRELERTAKRDRGAHASLATYARGDVIALANEAFEASAGGDVARVEPRSIGQATVPPDRSR